MICDELKKLLYCREHCLACFLVNLPVTTSYKKKTTYLGLFGLRLLLVLSADLLTPMMHCHVVCLCLLF